MLLCAVVCCYVLVCVVVCCCVLLRVGVCCSVLSCIVSHFRSYVRLTYNAIVVYWQCFVAAIGPAIVYKSPQYSPHV